jgi:hypothetical protein
MKPSRRGCYAQFMAIDSCRWPNNEFSVVNAKAKSDAIELLDEYEELQALDQRTLPMDAEVNQAF